MLRDGRLDLGRSERDTMIRGRMHERLVQQHEGLPVFGAQLVRQSNGRTTVSLFGRFFENVSVPTTVPEIEPDAAARIAERAGGQDATAGEPTLGILPFRDRFVLVYRVMVRSAWDIRTYDVNARSGAIEQSTSRIRTQSSPVVGSGTGVLNDPKKISTNAVTGGFEAVDLLRPATAFTLNFFGSPGRLNDFFETGIVFNSDIARNTSRTWTDGAIVDAHAYPGWVYDYFFKRFGRRGLDDQNLPIVSITHPLAREDASLLDPETVGLFINNAAYLGDGFMFYGDGDGLAFNSFAGALDIVGHELTHGVTSFTSGLDFRDEPGALNEAFSDVMGTAVEFFFVKPGAGPQKGPNFQVGEDIVIGAPGYIRNLQDPLASGYPDHYSLRRYIGTEVDDGGVHFNSTIAGHAFYLAVAGGTNRTSGVSVRGVGLARIERMERIFYRAFVHLLGPLAQFADARAATRQAATDLYGQASDERAQVEQAWTAVGVQ
jgi:Zn-dependent metalloprotease